MEAPLDQPARREPLSFTGTGGEYFRIWIVNLALTIVTLGIYSAWAKVRRLQYFYRHMRLAGAGFDYHGDPVAILKGRIVGLILFGLYSAAGYVNLWVAALIFAALAVLLPWLLGRSLRFRLRNSSYRGIRFKFHGTTKQAYWVFLAMPVFTVLSFFTLGPFWHHRLKRYQFTNAAYGRSRFSFGAGAGDFYVAYVLAACVVFGLMFGVVVMATVGLGVAIGAAGGRPPGGPPPPAAIAFVFMVAVGYAIAIIAAQAITTARIQNAVWNSAQLDTHRFVSEISPARLFWILITNVLATVVTLGLFRPFAQVRLAAYLAGAFSLVAAGDLGAFAALGSEEVAAIGEETAELFDFDIAF